MAKKTASSRPRKAAATNRSAPKAGARVSLDEVVRWLERRGTKKQIKELARYGITATAPYGVTVGALKKYAREIGSDHELALALWTTGRYEARMLAAMVDDPAKVTLAQMNAWAADFDNWAIVDTVCFHLFDRSPHAWKKVDQWATARLEFKKRASFALLWSLSVHDKTATNAMFRQRLPLIEHGARDDRDYVKKAVNMALRAIGKRNAALNKAAITVANRLASSDDAAPRWVGTHAARELTSAAVQKRLMTSTQ